MPASFTQNVLPLFGARDIACMARLDIRLANYDYMSDPAGDETFADHANARKVYDRLTGVATPRMPMGGPYWSDEQLRLFAQWMTDGFLA
jgi:hypothetical protein